MDENEVLSDPSEGAEDGSFGEFMQSIEESVVKMMRETTKAPKDMWEHFQAFKTAINWKEPLIIGLLSFHLFFFILVITTRKNVDFQTWLFLVICILVWSSEWTNSYLHDNYKVVATQNYFDKSGLFAGIMYSGPLLFIGFFQLCNFLYIASNALIVAKRLELKNKKKSENKSD